MDIWMEQNTRSNTTYVYGLKTFIDAIKVHNLMEARLWLLLYLQISHIKMSSTISNVPELDGTNYPAFHSGMQAYLRLNKVWGLVSGRVQRPQETYRGPTPTEISGGADSSTRYDTTKVWDKQTPHTPRGVYKRRFLVFQRSMLLYHDDYALPSKSLPWFYFYIS